MIKFLKSETGIKLLSIIFGLGLASMLRQACKGRNCIIVKAPNPADIESKIWEYNNKCYKFQTEHVKCSKNKETINSL